MRGGSELPSLAQLIGDVRLASGVTCASESGCCRALSALHTARPSRREPLLRIRDGITYSGTIKNTNLHRNECISVRVRFEHGQMKESEFNERGQVQWLTHQRTT